MGTTIAKKINGISLRSKIGIIFMLLAGIFLYQGVLKPLIGDTATNTYYFTTDTTAVNLGSDGSTSTAATRGGKISMKTGIYATSRSVTAAVNTTEQIMIRAYGPAYVGKKTVTAPAVTIGVRDRNGTQNQIWWKASVYDYNPAGVANNGVLLWQSKEVEAHPSVQTPLEIPLWDGTDINKSPLPKDVDDKHRLKVVITARMISTASSARLYWGSSTNYSFFKVTEADYVANSLTVTNLSDYYGGALANVTQGDSNVPMLQFDLYSNVSGGASWTGGLLDKIGTNTSIWQNIDEQGDVAFSIYKDSDGDGAFEASDTKIGGPYNFNQLIAQPYTLTTAQTILATPQRYFITYSIRNNAISNTTVGARIVDNSYFTVTGAAGGVQNVTSTSSSQPTIVYGGTAVVKNYPADWDSGTSLAGIAESSGPGVTDSTCIVRTTSVSSGFPLVGLLNYPAHSCTSVAGQNYSNTSGSTQADFVRLYFGGSGYHSDMLSVKGRSLTYRVRTPTGGGTVTLQLFYVRSDGVRVNAPITSKYTTTASVSQTITTSLAGQNFIGTPAQPGPPVVAAVPGIPKDARLGIQIGVTNGVQIGLGSAVGAQLQVEETAAENENVDVGNGLPTANAVVYAGDTAKVINSFTLTSSKPLASAKKVNSITIKGNALFNSTNVKEVKIYSDIPYNATTNPTGTLGVVDGTDTLLGSTTTITNNKAVVPVGSLDAYTTVKRYLVVVDIGDEPNTNIILTALVDDLAVATVGGIGENVDATSSTLTVLPTTTLDDGAGVTEPDSVILPSGAGATKLDAFRIKINGGVNDTFSNVKVRLSTTSTLPGTHTISDYVSRVDIVTAGGASLGHLTSPTQVNDWQVATIGLAATTTPTVYYVAITPKPGQSMTYNVKAQVVSIVHSRTTNKLVLTDAQTATIIMDQLPPGEPSPPQLKSTLTAVTGSYGLDADLAQINLNWTPSDDASGSAVSYLLVRGLGNAPPPRNCKADGVKTIAVYSGSGTSFVSKGLDEGVSYGYRVCAVDSVNNVSEGSAKVTTASIKDRCTAAQIPQLSISPSTSYIKAGNSLALAIGITSTETGACTPTTYTLSIIGSNPDDSNFTAAAFEGNNFIIAPNKGSQYTHLNISAKPGAIQNAERIFSVKIATSKGAEYVYPDPIHIKVNKFGTMMHSSMQLGTNKYGQWGMEYDCATCHHPGASNIKQVKDVITTPTGNRPVQFSIISTARNANVAGVFGNDLRSGTASTSVCEVCHHRARFHQYSASKVAWKEHNNNSDCMSCHSHSIGFKTLSTGLTCSDCHGNPPVTQEQLVSPPTNVLFPNATNAGSHDKHNQRGLQCATCHSNGNHLATAQPDTKLNMGFKVNNTNFPGWHGQFSSGKMRSLVPGNGYTYVNAAGMTIEQAPNTIMNCNVYCHGWDNNGGYNTEPAWTGITQVGCGSCHAASNEVPPESGSHHKHADSEPGFGNGIACSKCHGFRNYSTSSAHIDGDVEWDLSTITPTALYRGQNKGSTGFPAPTAPGNYGTCQNLYCHSNVVSSVNNNGTGAPDVFNTPTWGGTTNCNSCHQAQPNVTGGHPQHAGTGIGDASFDCRICHGNGGDANPLKHGDSYINFEFSGLGENTHYSYSSAKVPGSAVYGTCYNGNCHGSRRPKTGPTALTWGNQTATPLCDKCHTTSPKAGGFYGTMGPNGTTSKNDPYVGAHFQHITSMPYKLAAKYDCEECHYKPEGPYTPGHMDNALPAELTFGATASSGALNGYTSAQHQPSYDYGTRQCNSIWCHGSGMMSVEGTGLYGAARDDGAPENAARVAAPVWNSPFLAGTSADCQKCHASPPPAPLPGYNHWDDDNNRAYQMTDCWKCHKAVNTAGTGFANAETHANGVVDSCLHCHGLPPVDADSLTNPPLNALGEGMVGAHQAHFLNPTIGKRCNTCHYNYSYDMPSYKLEIGFNAYGGKVSRGTFYGYSTLTNSYSQPIVYFSTRSSTTVRRTDNKDNPNLKTCQNLYCHGGGINAATALQGGSNTKPGWEAGASQAECGACHGVTGDTYNIRGSHGAHVGTAFGELALACSICHGLKENNYHVDGQVEWQLSGTTAQGLNLASYTRIYTPAAGNGTAGASGKTNGLAPSASYGSCTVYCHSDGRGNYASPVWGGPAVHCGSCHINQTSNYNGSHAKHSAAYIDGISGGYGIDCLMCHDGSGFGSSKHINGQFDIAFNKSVVGASATYDSGAKKCFNILCHVSTGSTGPTWGNAATGNYDTGTYKPTCIGCHSGQLGARGASAAQFGGTSHHAQGAFSGSVCYQCHAEAADANGTVNTARHTRTANKPVDLMIWGAGARGAAFTSYTANGSTTRRRTELTKLNNHCLGCHNAANAAIQPFGDGKTPESYAWDGTSVAERYSVATTTLWAKVTGNNTVVKNNAANDTKAYSAHGRADLNERGWAVGTATSGETYTANTSGAINVLCFDCHNSHGTFASGVMSSYSSATGRYMGGILKSTANGISGYTADYTPVAGGDPAAPNKNAYNTGASLCFDCHNNAKASETLPWGYGSTASGGTFNGTKPIYGYHDKPYFGNYSTFANTVTYPYKKNNPDNKGGHYGVSSTLTTAVTQRTFSNGIKDKPYSAGASSPINGLCTPCHDPHGVSPVTPANQPYMVPLLKGTWVTSPYKQDAAPSATNETRGGGRRTSAIDVGSTPKYNIDQNAMGAAAGTTAWTFPGTPTTLQGTTDTQFAGLCTGCHTKAALNSSANATAANWKSVGRIHNSVKGWATATGGNANNSKHAFTCSKCHTPHNAKLPRLMVTNCLDAKHRGQTTSGGQAANAGTSAAAGNNQVGSSGAGAGRFPMGGSGGGSPLPLSTAKKWFFGATFGVNPGSNVIATTTQTLCHQSGTAGGAVYNTYTSQKWNKKTQW